MSSEFVGIETESSPSVTFEEALARRGPDAILVDTRTPKEFKEGHVIDALNIALMTDYQRHIIGYTYKHESKEVAISKGWEIFSPLVQDYLARYNHLKGKTIFCYCWRGGMRSRIVVNILIKSGFNAIQVQGGYKRYMNDIVWKGMKEFADSYTPKFIVLFGNTGTRKTAILQKLKSDYDLPVIDLEGLAGHRSSVYGGVDLEQKSQKMFTILLYHALKALEDSKYIFIEGEAHKIGDVHVPMFINDRILNDKKVLVHATLETRIEHLKQEYLQTDDSVRQLHQATDVVSKYAGKKNAEMLHKMLDEKDFDGFTEWLLVNYYDTRYRFGKKNLSYDLEVESDDLESCCTQLKEFYSSIL
eukprot:Nitzschia sp. Nitz4//scaffold44_size153857//22987//24063//NITZ4_002699-RA/size153857-processed-gene-0.117-mRNA-1//1//CDS//3329552091//2786//frame0